MSNFYGSFAYITCGNGCNSKLQKILFNESNQPIDMDWEGLQQIYNDHNASCSNESPYTNDKNAFYGNPDDCSGFVNEDVPNSGFKFCEA